MADVEPEGPFCIEVKECGVWMETTEVHATLAEALKEASFLCNSFPEERIRISTGDFKLL